MTLQMKNWIFKEWFMHDRFLGVTKYLLKAVYSFLIGVCFCISAESKEDEGEHLWNKLGIPHKGWNHVEVEVLPEATGVCEMCDKNHIRYMHTLQHAEYNNLQVGYVCAEKMCDDYVNPKEREKLAKKLVARERAAARREAERAQAAQERGLQKRVNVKRNWLDLSTWNMKNTGNYSRKLGGDWITLFKKGNGWKYVYNNNFSIGYPSIQVALQNCYDTFENIILNYVAMQLTTLTTRCSILYDESIPRQYD